MVHIDGLDIEWLGHDCFKIKFDDKILYFDPYKINDTEKADYIFITHEHYDHCSMEDLLKIIDRKTIIVAAQKCQKDLEKIEPRVKFITWMIPDELTDAGEINVESVPAYNVNKFSEPGKPFHPKGENRIGFIIKLKGKRLYHAGDTDHIPEMASLKNIDIAFIPVSGTYVMTPEEAAKAVILFKPNIAIPMHYGSIVGSKSDAERFKSLAAGIDVRILG